MLFDFKQLLKTLFIVDILLIPPIIMIVEYLGFGIEIYLTVFLVLITSNIFHPLFLYYYQRRILNKKIILPQDEKEESRLLVNEENNLLGGILLITNKNIHYYLYGKNKKMEILRDQIIEIKSNINRHNLLRIPVYRIEIWYDNKKQIFKSNQPLEIN